MTPIAPQAAGVDAHCHIDLFPSPDAVVARAEAAGVYTIAVTNAPSVFAHTLELTRGSRFVRPALGLHPELVRTHGGQLDQMLQLLPQTRYVGEIGLDHATGDADDHRRQARVFGAILERCASAGDKVLTVHSRRAAAEVVAAFGTSFPGVVILHWFSGGLRDLQKAIDAGMYFSVNPAMFRSGHGRKLIAAMPRDRVLTETDGPFVRSGARPAEPGDTIPLQSDLGGLWDCSAGEAGAVVVSNFLRAIGER